MKLQDVKFANEAPEPNEYNNVYLNAAQKVSDDAAVESSTDKAIDMLQFGVAASLFGGMDTIVQSLSFGAIKEKDQMMEGLMERMQFVEAEAAKSQTGILNKAAYAHSDFVGSYARNAMAYHLKHEAGTTLAGEIGTAFAPISWATKAIQTPKYLTQAFNKMGSVGQFATKVLISSGKTAKQRIESMKRVTDAFKSVKPGTARGIKAAGDVAEDQFARAAFAKRATQEVRGMMGDTMKEGAAAELAMFMTHSASETLYPEENAVATHLAFWLLPDLAISAIAGKYMRGQINRHIATEVAPAIAKSLNPLEIAITDVLARPGERSVKLATDATALSLSKQDAVPMMSAELKANATARIVAINSSMNDTIVKMGNDEVYKHGIDVAAKWNTESAQPYIKTLVKHAEQEPSAAIGITSINAYTPKSQTGIPKSIAARQKAIAEESGELKTAIDTFPADGNPKEYQKLLKQVDDLFAEKNKLDGHNVFVLEAEGRGIVPLDTRQYSIMDDMSAAANATLFAKTQDVTTLSKQASADMGNLTVGMTDGGSLLLEKASGAPYVMQLLRPAKVAEEFTEKAKLTLIDMTYLFNLTDGKIGREITNSMDSDLLKALHDWKGDSDKGMLRAWHTADDPKLTQLQDVFKSAGFHKRLYEVADEDGYMTLYRGQSKRETADAAGTGLISMSPNPRFADKKFGETAAQGGKDTIKVKVHVEDIIAPIDTGLHEFEFIVTNAHRRKLGTNVAGKAEAIQQLNFQQKMGMMAVTQRSVDKYNPATADPILAYTGKTFVELDYAVEILKAHPEARVQMTERAVGSNQRILYKDEALRAMQFESLSQKFKLWQDYWVNKQGADADLIKVPKNQQIDEAAFLKSVNLPAHAGIGDSETVRMFKTIAPRGGDRIVSFKSMFRNLDEFDDAIRKSILPNYLAEPDLVPRALDYTGGMIRAGRDYSQKPVVAHYADRLAGRIGPEQVNDLIAVRKADTMSIMSEAGLPANKAFLVESMFKSATSDMAHLSLARQVDNVIDGVLHEGAITGHVMKARSAEVVRANDRLFDPAYKKLQKLVSEVWEPHTETFTKLLSSKGQGSLNSVNIAVANLRVGWDILPGHGTLEAGKNVLMLDPASARNAGLYEKITGVPFKEALAANSDEVFMPVWHSGKKAAGQEEVPVILDDLGIDALARVTELSHTYLDNFNFIRKVKGLEPIRKREWHIPYLDISQENLVYIIDELGDVLRSTKGKTFDDALSAAMDEITTAAKDGHRYTYQTEGTLRAYVENAGDVFEAVRNFSAAGKQTKGIGEKGATEVVEIGTDVFKGIVDQLQKHFDDVGRYSASTIMESELNFIKQAKEALPIDPKIKAAGDTVYDHIERSITQTASLTPNSEMGAFYKSAEELVDGGLQRMWDSYRGLVKGGVQATDKQYEAIRNIYGDAYKPFENTLDMIARTTKRAAPPTAFGIVAGSSKVAGDLVLRIMDFGMPVLNFASVVAVAPAVIKAMSKMPDESVAAWRQRSGAYSTSAGEDFAVPNATKMAMSALHELFSKRGRAAYKRARDAGLLKQDVYERIEMITAPIDGYGKRMLKKGINKLSYATDKSEELSRAVSYMMMHGIAKDAMKLSDDAAMNFAHLHANAVVGDYRSMNKPELFQGAVGMPMGLFTTWIWNMGQRVFTDAAQGRLGAVAMQAMTQQFLFGTESIPGAGLYIEHLTKNYAGDRNIIDRLDEAGSRDLTDLLMKGTIGHFTGVDVGTRANLGIPAILSGGDLHETMPAVGVGKRIIEGLWEVGKTTYEQGPDLARYREILSQYSPNGMAKNAAIWGQGYSVDKAGDLVDDEVRRLKPVLAALMELKTIKQERLREDMAKDKIRQLTKNAHFERMGKRFKTLMRNVDRYSDAELDTEVEEILTAYDRANGDPQTLRQYVMGLTVKAQTSKPARLLIQKLKRNDDKSGTMRLLDSYTME